MSDVLNLTRDLLKIPSPSGEEKEIGNYLVNRLKKNFNVKTQKVGNGFNIIATRGIPEIILNIHLDTVPNLLGLREDKKYLYGRGACDAKGPLATMIVAGELAVVEGLTNFGLVFDVCEETDFSGVKKVIKMVSPEKVIVGEPTNFSVVVGQKGLIGFKIKEKGVSAHGATPKKGSSAVIGLLKKLDILSNLTFPNGCTLNIGKIKGGSAVNVVPESAQALVEIRTSVKNDKIIRLIQKTIGKVEVLYNFNPVITKNVNWVNKFANGLEFVPYFTEMYFWNKIGADTIVFGPGESKYAHSKDEKIKKQDLIKAVKLYLKILRKNCKVLNKRIYSGDKDET